jgi:putative copper resistance protein D
MTDPIVYARFVHFAATIVATGVVFFVAVILDPALRSVPDGTQAVKTLRPPLAAVAWSGLAAAFVSGAAWLVLTAAAMSGQTVGDAASPDVLWTVLSQTTFGNAWLLRLVLGCVLAALMPLLAPGLRNPAWLKGAAMLVAAAFVGSLAWAGHAIGGRDFEGFLHPAADVAHLVAAAAWLGTLVPLALLLGLSTADGAALAVMRAATLRFSTLGLVSVSTLLATGIVNTWYLAGSIPALLGTDYGRLLLIKIALFLLMVAVAAVNRLRLTPKLIDDRSAAAAASAQRQLRRNAGIEAALGAAIIAVVAFLGVLPPASHSHHHVGDALPPADSAYQHIHSEQGMADIIIEPGHVGTADATIRLWNDDLEPLDVRNVTLTLTAPRPGSKARTYVATRDDDGAWQIEGVDLTEAGNWAVAVDALLRSNARLKLEAQIVIEAR